MMTERSMVTLCGATKRQGDKAPCRRPAGWGTEHVGFGTCKLHGGSTTASTKHAAKERAAWQQRILDEIDPSLSVLVQLRNDEDVAPRDRIAAAKWFADKAVELDAGSGGLTVNIAVVAEWPLVLRTLVAYPEALAAVKRALRL
jgi:hypothetical protein